MSIEEDIVPGKILYLSVCFPHQERSEKKYLVLVGFDNKNRALLLKINSRIPYLIGGHGYTENGFRIKQTQYRFLDHESFLRCENVWYNILTYDEIKNQLLIQDGSVVGELIPDHRSLVVTKTANSKSISPKHKQIIRDSLTNTQC